MPTLIKKLLLILNFFLGLALLPLTLECGCELIFPVPEVVTNGLLMVFGQTFGEVIVFIMDAMKEDGTGGILNEKEGYYFYYFYFYFTTILLLFYYFFTTILLLL